MKTILYVLGAVFIIVGLLGFVNNPVLGLFRVNALYNLVHLASGILALIFAGMGERSARKFSLVLGIIYALVTILGFLMHGNILGILPTNGADNVLHLLLAIVFLVMGLSGRSAAPASTNSAM